MFSVDIEKFSVDLHGFANALLALDKNDLVFLSRNERFCKGLDMASDAIRYMREHGSKKHAAPAANTATTEKESKKKSEPKPKPPVTEQKPKSEVTFVPDTNGLLMMHKNGRAEWTSELNSETNLITIHAKDLVKAKFHSRTLTLNVSDEGAKDAWNTFIDKYRTKEKIADSKTQQLHSELQNKGLTLIPFVKSNDSKKE